MATIGSITALSGLVAFLAIVANSVARPHGKSHLLDFPESAEELPKIPDVKRKESLLMKKVIVSALRDRRDSAQHFDKDYIARRLEETLLHCRDLIYRANDTFNLLCHQKHALLPHNDPRLSTCRGFTQASLGIRKVLNIPDHAKYEIRVSSSEPRELLKAIYHKSWEITKEYEFVVANMTTLEEDYLCNGHSCRIKCTDRIRNSDPHSFLCQLRTLESRIISFSRILTRSMNMLQLSPKSNKVFYITERPSVSEHTRMMYNFAASYQLFKQAEEIEYAMQMARNIILLNK